jgi:hypothetical protein
MSSPNGIPLGQKLTIGPSIDQIKKPILSEIDFTRSSSIALKIFLTFPYFPYYDGGGISVDSKTGFDHGKCFTIILKPQTAE